MHFASDNWAGVPDAVSSALAVAAGGFATAYGDDEATAAATAAISAVFEREVAVFYVATGSAANSLALAAVTPPGAAVFCHEAAHIVTDECNAPLYLTGGARLVGIQGERGKIHAGSLAATLERFGPANVHHGRAAAVSITQATELGTLYNPAEVAAIAGVTHAHGLTFHMDGARFANAVARLGVSPADLTWRAGVDMLSFGLTKVGAWAAESIVVFDPERAAEIPYLRKRAGHLFSKSRFISAQFSALLKDGLWLDLARHANAMAARLTEGLRTVPGARLAWEPEANEIFPILPVATVARLEASGARFYEWGTDGLHGDALPVHGQESIIRLVTSFRTTADEVDQFLAIAAG